MAPQELMKQQLAGLAGQEAKIVLFQVPPGWTPPRHVHPGHLFLYMLKGSVELLSKVGDGCFQAARSISFSPSLNLTPSTISARR